MPNLSFVERLSRESISNPIITWDTIFFLDAFFLELARLCLNFRIEDLNKLRFCVRGRISDVMVTQYTKQLRYSEGTRIEVGSEIFSQTDNLCSGQARHG